MTYKLLYQFDSNEPMELFFLIQSQEQVWTSMTCKVYWKVPFSTFDSFYSEVRLNYMYIRGLVFKFVDILY